MPVITPTITTDDKSEFKKKLNEIKRYAQGVHIDIADGTFAPTKLLDVTQMQPSDRLITHLHVMYAEPMSIVDQIIAFSPDLVIVHAESSDYLQMLNALQAVGLRTGIALLAETETSVVDQLYEKGLVDHALFFGGHLGYQGGDADMSLLKKLKGLKMRLPDIEIGWDGGVNDQNVRLLVDAGVDVINVGSFIAHADDPKKAYDKLMSLLS